MNKRTRLHIALGLLLFFLLLLLFAKFLRLPFVNIRLEEAMPHQSAYAISFRNDMLNLDIRNAVFASLIPENLKADLLQFQKHLPSKYQFAKNQRFLVVIHPSGNSEFEILYITHNARDLDIEKLFQRNQQFRTRKYSHKNHPVYHVKYGNSQFFVSTHRNILLFSTKANLLESAIVQLRRPFTSLYKNDHFTGVQQHNVNGGNNWQIFINLEQLSTQFAPLVDPLKLSSVASFSKFGNWLKIQFPNRGPFKEWEGALSTAQNNRLLESNRRAASKDFKSAFTHIPEGLGAIVWMSIQDYIPARNLEFWRKYMKSWVGNEIAFATGEPAENNIWERFMLIKRTSISNGNGLSGLLNRYGREDSSGYQMFKIYRLQGTNFSQNIGLEDWMDTPWVTDLGSYVLFSNSRSGHERWLDKYIAGQSLSKSLNLLKMLRPMPLDANGFLYLDSGNSWQQVSNFLEDSFEAGLSGNPLMFNQLALTWTRTGNICKFKVVTEDAQSDFDKGVSILWRVKLGADMDASPFVFKSTKTGESKIFVQDKNNTIYLISQNGKIIWRRNLDSPILSDIAVIDLNNSGEAQIVFNTRQKLFIVDDQGNDMEGYPLELKVPASNGVSVVDFFNSGDYLFFIACENEKGYGFNERGVPIEGWRPHDSIGYVTLPIVHFQADSRDFMLAQNERGVLQVFQKNGESRFKIKTSGPIPQKPDFQIAGSNSRIVACDSTGKVLVVNLAGNSFGLNLKVGKNSDVRFTFADVTGDERKDYIATSGEFLSVHAYEGNDFKILFEKKLPSAISGVFAIKPKEGQKSYIGVVQKQAGKIMMLDGGGRLLPQFPLAGTTSFSVVDILNDGKATLITGNKDQVFAYKLN
jgi:hypothetical protein